MKGHQNPSEAVVLMCVECPPLYSLALRGMYGSSGMDKRSGGGRSSPVVVSLSLFGEFADDADQCSIFIFKTLVVCSQVNQNLQVEVKS